MKKIRITGTVVGLFFLALFYIQPFPLFDRSSTTIICSSRDRQMATAKALSQVIGEPRVTLDTPDLYRFIFGDGTSTDSFVHPPEFVLMYKVVALKQIALGLLSRSSPMDLAMAMKRSWENDGYKVQIVSQPDRAFPSENVVLVLSEALQNEEGSGSAVIIRKHVLRIGGQKPNNFESWPQE